MECDCNEQEIINVIDGYLANGISAKEASEWALKLIIERDLDQFPKRVRYALQLVFELHDEGKSWCPTREELEDCKRLLLDKSDRLPPFVEDTLKPKFRTRRGIRKEISKFCQRAKEISEKENNQDGN